MDNFTSIDGFSVLSPSQKKELERQRKEEEARKAAKKAEEARKSQEAARKAEEEEAKRKAEAAKRKAKAEEKEQRRKALIVFLYIVVIVTIVVWIYVSFNCFNWLSEKDDSTLAQIIEGCLNMLWTVMFICPIGGVALAKLGDLGWH